MILKTQNEIWIQGLYGINWEDFQEAIDMPHAEQILQTLTENRPNAKFRIIERTTTDVLHRE